MNHQGPGRGGEPRNGEWKRDGEHKEIEGGIQGRRHRKRGNKIEDGGKKREVKGDEIKIKGGKRRRRGNEVLEKKENEEDEEQEEEEEE